MGYTKAMLKSNDDKASLVTHSYSIVQDICEKLIVTQLIKEYPAFFTEPEGSLSCSRKPTTGSYPKPAESSSLH
jgi:hypothetical protein